MSNKIDLLPYTFRLWDLTMHDLKSFRLGCDNMALRRDISVDLSYCAGLMVSTMTIADNVLSCLQSLVVTTPDL
jgi:hypothetical protein